MMGDVNTGILLLEPYYTGSHKVLMDVLHKELQGVEGTNVKLMTLTGKKWHWRARTSALYFAQNIEKTLDIRLLFTSCVLPLHELLGLRPDLQSSKKVIYFHENQLIYPVRKSKDRDFQYGYNQIMSCLAADVILFNSRFNQESFLSAIKPFFKLQPDYRPANIREQIEPKCQVLYFPLTLSTLPKFNKSYNCNKPLRLVWPHRWEFDKNPEMFFRMLFALHSQGKPFRLNVLGESFTDNPPIFEEARTKLSDCIEHFGFVPDKSKFYEVLANSDIVVSTADHEFFGVAMLEGVNQGCFPLAPNRLVYPEIFPFQKCLYNSEEDLLERLASFLDNPGTFQAEKDKFFTEFSFDTYDWKHLKKKYIDILL